MEQKHCAYSAEDCGRTIIAPPVLSTIYTLIRTDDPMIRLSFLTRMLLSLLNKVTPEIHSVAVHKVSNPRGKRGLSVERGRWWWWTFFSISFVATRA